LNFGSWLSNLLSFFKKKPVQRVKLWADRSFLGSARLGLRDIPIFLGDADLIEFSDEEVPGLGKVRQASVKNLVIECSMYAPAFMEFNPPKFFATSVEIQTNVGYHGGFWLESFDACEVHKERVLINKATFLAKRN
jgi:hypothetical protein